MAATPAGGMTTTAEAGKWNKSLCAAGQPGNVGCCALCCTCFVIGATQKMVETGAPVAPDAGVGLYCFASYFCRPCVGFGRLPLSCQPHPSTWVAL